MVYKSASSRLKTSRNDDRVTETTCRVVASVGQQEATQTGSECEVDGGMLALTNGVARTTHVFPRTTVVFVVVQGDEVPDNKTPRVSIGATTPTRKRVKTGRESCNYYLDVIESRRAQ